MAVIGWGKPKIFYKDLGTTGAQWTELTAVPVENSTQLETSKGDKKEAKVEGGENQDVRYNKNTYALSFALRAAKSLAKPIQDADGLVTNNYSIAVQPEDATIQGILIDKARVSVEDTWSTDEGGLWTYTFNALKSDDTTHTQVQWGVIAYSSTDHTLTCTPVS